MGLAAQGTRWDRWRERQEVCLRGIVQFDGDACEIEIEDVSDAGCGARVRASLRVGSLVEISAPRIGSRVARVTRKSGVRYGFAFDAPSPIYRGAHLKLVETGTPVPSADVTASDGRQKLPGRVRMTTILASSVLLWAVIGLIVRNVAV